MAAAPVKSSRSFFRRAPEQAPETNSAGPARGKPSRYTGGYALTDRDAQYTASPALRAMQQELCSVKKKPKESIIARILKIPPRPPTNMEIMDGLETKRKYVEKQIKVTEELVARLPGDILQCDDAGNKRGALTLAQDLQMQRRTLEFLYGRRGALHKMEQALYTETMNSAMDTGVERLAAERLELINETRPEAVAERQAHVFATIDASNQQYDDLATLAQPQAADAASILDELRAERDHANQMYAPQTVDSSVLDQMQFELA